MLKSVLSELDSTTEQLPQGHPQPERSLMEQEMVFSSQMKIPPASPTIQPTHTYCEKKFKLYTNQKMKKKILWTSPEAVDIAVGRINFKLKELHTSLKFVVTI